jgi:hypothetical protein
VKTRSTSGSLASKPVSLALLGVLAEQRGVFQAAREVSYTLGTMHSHRAGRGRCSRSETRTCGEDFQRLLWTTGFSASARVKLLRLFASSFYHFFYRTQPDGASRSDTSQHEGRRNSTLSRTDQNERARLDTGHHGRHVSFNPAGRVRDPGGPQCRPLYILTEHRFTGLIGPRREHLLARTSTIRPQTARSAEPVEALKVAPNPIPLAVGVQSPLGHASLRLSLGPGINCA